MQNADSSGAPTAADDRATTFQPTEGGSEQRSGQTLMVEAYAVIWTILMVWLVMLWRRQASLNQKLDGLEEAIVRASSRAAPAPAGAAGGATRPAAATAPEGKLGGQPSS
jgi:CcmD family protein